MAVSETALKRQQSSRSAFGIPVKSTVLSRIPPPQLHYVCRLTGGLSKLYQDIQKPGKERDEQDEVPLLAKRYQFVRFLGKGCSATLIQALDTFRSNNYHVAIKMLKQEYYALGYQESNNVERLNCADPHDFSGTVRLLNTFSFDGQFCLVFELLHPKPLHHYFKRIPAGPKKLQLVRKVALQLLQVLGFMQQENVIHADLKPENILCRTEDLSSGIKVIDFGNAIHCVYDELSLYYDDFELQTLLYRAPEVVYGLPFGPEIDVWSLGCILAELYLGEPLFFALTKEELLQKMVAVLGPLPVQVFQRGKFYSQYECFVGEPQSMLVTQSKLLRRLGDMRDYNFGNFLFSILRYNPSERMSLSEAFFHPFLAPEVAARFLFPPGSKDVLLYNKVNISPSIYTFSPTISIDAVKEHLSSISLLRRGTSSLHPDPVKTKKPKRAVAEVAPFAPKQNIKSLQSPDVRIPVKGSVPVQSGVSVDGKPGSEEDSKMPCSDMHKDISLAHTAVVGIVRLEESGPFLLNSLQAQSFKHHLEPQAFPKHLKEQHHLDAVSQFDISESRHTTFHDEKSTSLTGSRQIQSKYIATDAGRLLLDKNTKTHQDTSSRKCKNHRNCQKPKLKLKTESTKLECTGNVVGVRSGKHTRQNKSAMACSPGRVTSYTSSCSLKDPLCDRTEETVEDGEHCHRPQVVRKDLSVRNPLDTTTLDTGMALENEESPEMYKKSLTKELPKSTMDSIFVSPQRPPRVTKSTSSFTLSDSDENAIDDLNLLTPPISSQVHGSRIQQLNNQQDKGHKSTPKEGAKSDAKPRKITQRQKKAKTNHLLQKSSQIHHPGVMRKLKRGRPHRSIPNSLRNDLDTERNFRTVSKEETKSFGIDECCSNNPNSPKTRITSEADQDKFESCEDVNSFSFGSPEEDPKEEKYKKSKRPKILTEDRSNHGGSPARSKRKTSDKSVENQSESKSKRKRKSKMRAQIRIKARVCLSDPEPYQWWKLKQSEATVPDMSSKQNIKEDTVAIRLGHVFQAAKDVLKRTNSKHSSGEGFEVECEDECRISRTTCDAQESSYREGRTLSSSEKRSLTEDVIAFEDLHSFESHQKSTKRFLSPDSNHNVVSKRRTAKRDLSKQFLTQGRKSHTDFQQKALLNHKRLRQKNSTSFRKINKAISAKSKPHNNANSNLQSSRSGGNFVSNKTQDKTSRTMKGKARDRPLKRKVDHLGKRGSKRKVPQGHTARSASCPAPFKDLQLDTDRSGKKELFPWISDNKVPHAISCQRVSQSEIRIKASEQGTACKNKSHEKIDTTLRESIRLVDSVTLNSTSDDDEVMLLLP